MHTCGDHEVSCERVPHPRPPLAAIICIYLTVTAFIPLSFIFIYVWGWFHSVFIYRSTLPHSPLSLAVCLLAVAGAVTLWQMRRAAFFLIVAHFLLSLLIMAVNLPRSLASFHRMSTTMPTAIFRAARMLSMYERIAQLFVSVVIVWYVYQITSRKRLTAETAEPELTA
jgi:hypothetical protein